MSSVFDVFEMGAGLVFRVGDDPDIGLDLFQRGFEDEGQRAERGFGRAARGEDVEFSIWRFVELEIWRLRGCAQ